VYTPVVDFIGTRAVGMGRYISELVVFFSKTLATSLKRNTAGADVIRSVTLRQVYYTAVQAVPVVSLLAVVFGAVIIFQTLSFFSAGASVVGTLLDNVVIRELGPLFTAFIVIGRSGSAITVELGNLKTDGELELLQGLGIDPYRYIVIPRMIGVTIGVICLCILFDLVAMLGGYAFARLTLQIPGAAFVFLIAQEITVLGVFSGLLKSAVFGLLISTVSCYHGLRVSDAVTSVPPATQQSVVYSLVLCVLANIVITAAVFRLEGLI
jgi:phospholipid/cholesterol/gamma-HCH transport system permease protein